MKIDFEERQSAVTFGVRTRLMVRPPKRTLLPDGDPAAALRLDQACRTICNAADPHFDPHDQASAVEGALSVRATLLLMSAVLSYLYWECDDEEERTYGMAARLADLAGPDGSGKDAFSALVDEVKTGVVWDDELGEWVELFSPRPEHCTVQLYEKFASFSPVERKDASRFAREAFSRLSAVEKADDGAESKEEA